MINCFEGPPLSAEQHISFLEEVIVSREKYIEFLVKQVGELQYEVSVLERTLDSVGRY